MTGERLVSALLPRCRASRRRSLDRTDSSHSTVATATACPAPRGFLPGRLSDAGPRSAREQSQPAGIRNPSPGRPFAIRTGTGSVRWEADPLLSGALRGNQTFGPRPNLTGIAFPRSRDCPDYRQWPQPARTPTETGTRRRRARSYPSCLPATSDSSQSRKATIAGSLASCGR